MTRTLRSSTLRLALIYIALLATAIFGLLGYVYGSMLSALHRQAANEATREHALLAAAYRRGGRDGLVDAIRERLAAPNEGWRYLLIDGSGRPLAGNLAQWPAATDASDRAEVWLRGGAMAAELDTFPDGSRLLVGHREGSAGFARTMALVLGGAAFGIIVLAAALASRPRAARCRASRRSTRPAVRSCRRGSAVASRGAAPATNGTNWPTI